VVNVTSSTTSGHNGGGAIGTDVLVLLLGLVTLRVPRVRGLFWRNREC
jgi:hypothetical protein